MNQVPTSRDFKGEIEDLVQSARRLVPGSLLDPLAIDASLGVPAWRDFEHQIWAIGQQIRQLLLKAPHLRADGVLQRQIVEVACDRRAHRGRQSFVMLLGYRPCAEHARRLVEHLDDPFVAGHVVGAIYKMRAAGYSEQVRPLLEDKMAWVRNEARRYLAWEAASNKAMQPDAASRRR
jgi:hypothetical protein